MYYSVKNICIYDFIYLKVSLKFYYYLYVCKAMQVNNNV